MVGADVVQLGEEDVLEILRRLVHHQAGVYGLRCGEGGQGKGCREEREALTGSAKTPEYIRGCMACDAKNEGEEGGQGKGCKVKREVLYHGMCSKLG